MMKKIYHVIFQKMPIQYKEWTKKQLIFADFEMLPAIYYGFSLFYGLVLGMVIFLITFILGFSLIMSLGLGIFSILIFVSVMHVIPIMASDKRAKFTDEVLPDALRLIASNIRSGLTPDKALLLSARPEFGPLEIGIRDSAKLTFSGQPIEDAIQTISQKINSRALKRSIDLLTEGMSRGGNIADLLDELSNDIRQARILRKEVKAMVMMYAIFIFFATGIGAPLLYGISSFLVETMQDMGSSVSVEQAFTGGMNIMTFQNISITPEFLYYYVSFSLAVTSFFGGLLIGLIQEGSEKAGLRYIPILIAVSLSIFFLTRLMVERLFGAMV
jgi:flagellar protein FlaJ